MAVSERAAPGRRITVPGESLMLVGLLAVFAASGASGLIYQVVWVRTLSLTFGVTAWAISTVLAGFFSGLALGSFLAGRIAGRLRSPLRAYALAEVAVAAVALLTPALFAAGRDVWVALYPHLPTGGWSVALVRFTLAFAVLLPPTTLMGATLPLIVRSSLARTGSFGRNVSLLYAFNTFGAAVGAFAAGFELIGRFGLRRSLLIGAVLNLLAAAGAMLLTRFVHTTRSAPDVTTHDEGELGPAYSGRVAAAALAGFGVSGALSLAYEIVWARVLAIFFDASTYGFTAMLTMVLLGIGAGSWLVSPLIGRRANWPLVFAGIQAGVGLLGLLAIPLFTHLIPLGERIGLYHDPGPLGQFGLRFMAFAAFVVVFPSMLLLGASFPVAARVAGGADGVRRVGGVYAVNVLGGIAGSLLGGFVLLPGLGARSSLLLLAAASLALAVVLLWSFEPRLDRRAGAALAGVALVGVAALSSPDLLTGIFRDRFAGERVLFADEGLENTATVTEVPGTGERKLYINGQPQATTVDFIERYHRLIGHLPVVLHPDPKRALVIGLGGGATGGAVAVHSGVEVDLVELSDAVVNAAPLFSAINEGVLDRPNVALRVDDGRNFLLLTERRYDVITADIIRPEHAGANALYAREYYRLTRGRLAPGGLMLQWLEQLSEERYRILLNAFVAEFPHVELWADGSLAVGSNEPLRLDRATLARRLADPSARDSLASIGLRTPDDVLALYTGNRAEALRYLQGERRATTDDRPWVEFSRTLDAERRPFLPAGFTHDPRAILGE